MCRPSYLKICIPVSSLYLPAVFRSLDRSLDRSLFLQLPCFVCLSALTERLAQAKKSFLVVISFNIFFLIGYVQSTLVHQPGSMING